MAEFSAAKCKKYDITEQIFYKLKVNRVNSIEYIWTTKHTINTKSLNSKKQKKIEKLKVKPFKKCKKQ